MIENYDGDVPPAGLAAGIRSIRKLEDLWRAKQAACQVTHRHEIGVGLEVESLARFLGWDKVTVDDFAHCAMFHDVGKMLTPREVLFKAGPLDEAEMEVMKRHAGDGAEILSPLAGVIGEVGSQMAHFHHERPDGLGYHGLSGAQIPAFARICAVADVYEAMTSQHRPYKAAFTPGETLIMMARSADPGKLGRDQFDPSVFQSFVTMKIAREKELLSPDEVAVLRDFLRTEGVSRKADLAAFRIGLNSLDRELNRNMERDRRLAQRIMLAAEKDPEKLEMLRNHAVAATVSRLHSKDEPTMPAAKSVKSSKSVGREPEAA